MRDLGLEGDCLRLGNRGECLNSIRWCYDMSSVEYGKYTVSYPSSDCSVLEGAMDSVSVSNAQANGHNRKNPRMGGWPGKNCVSCTDQSESAAD